jgi:tRNA(adenine34) deaminase
LKNKDLLNFLDIAIKESVKALNANEVPIGSIVVCNKSKKVISKAYNMTEKLGDPMAHAEIIAIQKAAKKIGDWRLDNHSIFTTIEPCNMCMEVIKAARIKKIYYGSKNTSKVKLRKKPEKISLKSDFCKEILKNFFRKKR